MQVGKESNTVISRFRFSSIRRTDHSFPPPRSLTSLPLSPAPPPPTHTHTVLHLTGLSWSSLWHLLPSPAPIWLRLPAPAPQSRSLQHQDPLPTMLSQPTNRLAPFSPLHWLLSSQEISQPGHFELLFLDPASWCCPANLQHSALWAIGQYPPPMVDAVAAKAQRLTTCLPMDIDLPRS